MKEQLEQLRTQALSELAGVNSEDELQSLKVKFLGKRGSLLQ